jgi:hypothetical protein
MNKYQGDYYRITVNGHLDDHWKTWFAGMKIQNLPEGTATLSGYIVDQSELYGLLKKVQDSGIPLVSVQRLDNSDHPSS